MCRCVLKTLACRKNAFKHSYTVECGNRLRVGVRAKNRWRVGVCVSALLRWGLWKRAEKAGKGRCRGRKARVSSKPAFVPPPFKAAQERNGPQSPHEGSHESGHWNVYSAHENIFSEEHEGLGCGSLVRWFFSHHLPCEIAKANFR